MNNETQTLAEETEAGWLLQQLQAYVLNPPGASAMTPRSIDAAVARLDELVPDMPDREVS